MVAAANTVGHTAKIEVGDDATVSREFWLIVAEQLRDDPELLPEIRKESPPIAELIDRGVRTLAIDASSQLWRDPREGYGGRPDQLIPGTAGASSDRTDWLAWLLTGGRGSGKTRTGAEGVKEFLYGRTWTEIPQVALIGQTLDDVHATMIENTLLQILPPGAVRGWYPNRKSGELILNLPEPRDLARRRRPFARVAVLRAYSAEAPRKLRGGNNHIVWGDELASWKDANRSPKAEDTTWSTAALSLRAHDNHTWDPRAILTTTPKAVRLLRNPDPTDPLNPGPGLYDMPTTVISAMSTMANLANLAPHFFETVIKPLIGTRLYRQEVLGELISAQVGALWSMEMVERMSRPRVWIDGQAGGLVRIVVGADPSVGSGATGDECGIIVSGLAADGRAYVLEDASLRGTPREWCDRIAHVYSKWGADCVVAEVNQGFSLIDETMGRYHRNLPIVSIRAKKGKRPRAEPIALLSDRDRVRFACDRNEDGELEGMGKLMHQLTTWTGLDGGDSPDRLDAFVYSILELMPVQGIDALLSSSRPHPVRA